MKGKILLALLVVLLLIAGAYAVSVVATYSDGYRAGQIIKMSKKGFLFKTNEGQLNTGGGFGGEGDMTSSIWDFSVARSNKEVLKKIEDAVDGQYRVKLHYKEKYFKHSWRGDTKYFVYDVETMETPQKNQQNNNANNAANRAAKQKAFPGGANNNLKPQEKMTIEQAREIIRKEQEARGFGKSKTNSADEQPVPQ